MVALQAQVGEALQLPEGAPQGPGQRIVGKVERSEARYARQSVRTGGNVVAGGVQRGEAGGQVLRERAQPLLCEAQLLGVCGEAGTGCGRWEAGREVSNSL